MGTYTVTKDTEHTDKSGSGGYQISDIVDNDDNNISDDFDLGNIYQNDQELKDEITKKTGDKNPVIIW